MARYDPWKHARDIGLRVDHRPLEAGLWVYYDHRRGRAVLNVDLCQFERRATLAHEVVHHERGDVGCLAARHELQVRMVAARRLVTLDDLTDALLWTRDEHQLAERLWVDVQTVRCRLTDAMRDSEYTYLQRRLAAAERYIA